MTQEKLSKMITGIVIAATLFLVILFGVLVYQWITMGVQQRRLNEAKAEHEALTGQYEELLEESEGFDDFWKYDLALKYGILEEGK